MSGIFDLHSPKPFRKGGYREHIYAFLKWISLLASILFLFCLCNKKSTKPAPQGLDTLDTKNNKIVFIGDTQLTSHWEFWREVNEDKTRNLFKEITRRKPAFVIDLGDSVTRGSSNKHWKFFDEVHSSLFENKIPIFPILGNHNYYGNNQLALHNYFAHFPHLKNQKWYSFSFRNIGFLMLDSNYLELTNDEKLNQKEWFKNELQEMDKQSEIKFVIVCCHHPPFTNSMVISPSEVVRKDFAELFKNSKKASIFFSGHCHSYEKFIENGKYFIVSGGGGGPRHRVQTDKTKRKFNDLFNGPSIRFFHFCEMTIHPERVEMDVVKLNKDGTFEIADKVMILSN